MPPRTRNETTAWQERFVQFQVSPERIIITGLLDWEQERFPKERYYTVR
jgi:hypothetical protein